jgi:CO/xanthine dehydrogenase Mo-binding subunit
MVYDRDGQPLSTTFMDFLIPTAMEVPPIETEHIETPSPLNPLGIKGAGEAGVIPVAALMAQALEDALSPWGVHITEMPLNPGQIRSLIRDAPFFPSLEILIRGAAMSPSPKPGHRGTGLQGEGARG